MKSVRVGSPTDFSAAKPHLATSNDAASRLYNIKIFKEITPCQRILTAHLIFRRPNSP